jgi:hypothetical protein
MRVSRVRASIQISVRGGEGILFGRYARSGGAPNYAPSLRSVAGLLVARESGLRGHPHLPYPSL